MGTSTNRVATRTAKRKDVNPFQEGYTACQNGIGVDECPYQHDSSAYSEWCCGWMQAFEDGDE